MSRLNFPTLLCAAALLGASVTRATVVDFTWIGIGGNSSPTTTGNWVGGVAPTFSGGFENLIFPNQGIGFINFTANSDLYGLNVTGHYHLNGAFILHLYDGGLTASSTYQTHLVFENSMGVDVATAQTWNIGSNMRVEFYNGAYVTGSGKITKTGAGTLDFNSTNANWTGGLQFNEGTITLRPGNYGTGENESRSLGTGAVTIGADTANRPTFEVLDWSNSGSTTSSSDDEVTLANNFELNGVFSSRNHAELTLLGNITLNTDTTFSTKGDITVVEGAVGESGGARKLTVDSTSALVLSGASNWTGGTDVTKGVLIFAGDTPNLPTGTANILVGTDGYAGIGAGNSISSFMGKISTASTGTIGFDSDPDGLPDTFNQTTTIDLSGYNASLRLGSASWAKLGSTVTIPPFGTNYRFGGGGGWLQVDSALTSGRTVTLDSPSELPLTVRFTNTGNAFSGITLTNSGAVFAPGALPGSATLSLGNGAYLGTEDTAVSASSTALDAYLTRFGAGTPGIIGFDIDQFATTPTTRVVDLTGAAIGSLTGGGYLGTASALFDVYGDVSGPGVRFTGAIAPNSDNVHRFAAYKGGALEVAGTLSGNSLSIGHPTSLGAFGDRNREEYSTVLISGNNGSGLAGGTTLYGGRLMVGQATGDGTIGTTATNALGVGPLTVAPVSFTLDEEEGPKSPSPMLAASASNLIIGNSIVVNAPELRLGGDNNFTLSGVVSGSGELSIGEESDYGFGLTLSGANTYSGGTYVSNGATLIAGNDTALGVGKLAFGNSAGQVQFSTTAPVIHGLESYTSDAKVWLTNTNSARLRIIQSSDTTYTGELRADSGATGAHGAFVKEGAGALRLVGVNIYGNGQGGGNDIIEVKAGALVLADVTFASSSGTLKVNGGTLALDNNESIANPISVIAGKLAGNGTFSSLVSLPTATGLIPGLNGAGTLIFSGGLSLTGGVVMDFGLGSISDRLLVTGGTLTGPASGTVTLNLSTLAGFKDGTYTLIDWNGASLSSLTAASFNIGNVPDGMLVSDFTLSVSGTTLLVFTPVPEPSTYALMLAGLGAIALHLKRRRIR